MSIQSHLDMVNLQLLNVPKYQVGNQNTVISFEQHLK
jgi:hypothetical protein